MSYLLDSDPERYLKNPDKVKIAIIGLGYVGLPLAIEFAKKYDVLGFDTDTERINQLNEGIDQTKEADIAELNSVVEQGRAGQKGLHLSLNKAVLINYNIFIVTVPTPVNQYKSPDLTSLMAASAMIGGYLKKGDIVIYESTVYPGCTEDDCVPILEQMSRLKFNSDFFVGYSPERISPGDKVNTLTTIKKVTSGSTESVAELVDKLYASVITAGTFKAASIKVAEASKAIENAQRDVNISFVNELALICDRIGIDTNDVLDAAATKWNFLKYKPGLVGGHCIGVDPYYLAHKAELLGYHPEVILSGRRVNDNMGMFIANKVVKLLIKKGHKIDGAKALILGITFKENCPDIRNTKVVDIYHELKQFGINVAVHDAWADAENVKKVYGINLTADLNTVYDTVILAVAHSQYKELDILKLTGPASVIFDTKAFIKRELVDARL